ncbi:hypothetical protein V1478_010893 [Vespula squamosa]|uniref:Uncharacterized protein n=1 Tax=Vespula squamosa TaxID=30214 RepID=A0ABD2AFN0_VESSQ
MASTHHLCIIYLRANSDHLLAKIDIAKGRINIVRNNCLFSRKQTNENKRKKKKYRKLAKG